MIEHMHNKQALQVHSPAQPVGQHGCVRTFHFSARAVAGEPTKGQ